MNLWPLESDTTNDPETTYFISEKPNVVVVLQPFSTVKKPLAMGAEASSVMLEVGSGMCVRNLEWMPGACHGEWNWLGHIYLE